MAKITVRVPRVVTHLVKVGKKNHSVTFKRLSKNKFRVKASGIPTEVAKLTVHRSEAKAWGVFGRNLQVEGKTPAKAFAKAVKLLWA